MKVRELIEELRVRDPEAKVFIVGENGDNVEIEKLFRIQDDKVSHKQDVLLTENF